MYICAVCLADQRGERKAAGEATEEQRGSGEEQEKEEGRVRKTAERKNIWLIVFFF